MKKKFKYIIFIIALVLPLGLSLTSCSDDNSPEDFNEYQIRYKTELLSKAIGDIKAQKGSDTLIRIFSGGIEAGVHSLSHCDVEGDYFLVGESGIYGRFLVTKYVGYSFDSVFLIQGNLENDSVPGLYFE